MCILYTTLSRLHTHEAIQYTLAMGRSGVCVCNIINCNCIVQVVCSIVGIPLSLSLSLSVCVCVVMI